MSSKDDPEIGAATQITTGLFKLSLVLRHQAWKDSGKRGLTPTQSQILTLVSALDSEVSISTVTQQLSITKGTASEAVSALERKKLLRKVPDAADGRAVVLKLTAKGSRKAQQSAQWPDLVVTAVNALPNAEQGAFLRGLTGLIGKLQESGAIPTSRMCAQCRFFRPNLHPGQDKLHHCTFIEAPIANFDLRIDCPEMEPAPDELQPQLIEAFFSGTQLDSLNYDDEGLSQ